MYIYKKVTLLHPAPSKLVQPYEYVTYNKAELDFIECLYLHNTYHTLISGCSAIIPWMLSCREKSSLFLQYLLKVSARLKTMIYGSGDIIVSSALAIIHVCFFLDLYVPT